MALHSPHPNEMEFVAALSTVYHACLFLIKLGALRGTQIINNNEAETTNNMIYVQAVNKHDTIESIMLGRQAKNYLDTWIGRYDHKIK